MSSWRGKKNSGASSYSQSANRLREKLQSRNQSNDDEDENQTFVNRPPPGLKGREIGLWYAQRQAKRSHEQKMVRNVVMCFKLIFLTRCLSLNSFADLPFHCQLIR